MIYTVMLDNPASGVPYAQYVEADSLQQAQQRAKERWSFYVLYVKHVAHDSPDPERDRYIAPTQE